MRLLADLFSPSFDWIQVEVTSSCNARCLYCPHTVFREIWKTEHMSFQTYEKLLPSFRRSALVYLQGWGEPLTHPDFFEMVREARKHCNRIGTTTNGTLVDSRMASRMVSEGLSVVGFSLAGTGPAQDSLRRGSSLQAVMQAIRLLHQEKQRRGVSLPKIHVAYLWLRSQRDAVRELPSLLAGSGVSQVVVATLDLVPHEDLAGEIIAADNRAEQAALEQLVAEVVEKGADTGLDIHFQPVRSNRILGTCSENVTKTCFVSCDGWVSACVFRNLPVRQDRVPEGGGMNFPGHLRFGNINEKSLDSIWNSGPYRAFRRMHSRGHIPVQCQGCLKTGLPHGSDRSAAK